MSQIFVKAHRRGKSIVKAFMRKGQLKSTVKAQKSLAKINAAIIKAGSRTTSREVPGRRYNGWRSTTRTNTTVNAAAKKAAGPYHHGSMIMKAQIEVKKAVGRALMNRGMGATKLKPVRYETTDIGKTQYLGRWDSRYLQNIKVAGPVSSFPRGSKIDYRAMVDPHGRYHTLQAPKMRRAPLAARTSRSRRRRMTYG